MALLRPIPTPLAQSVSGISMLPCGLLLPGDGDVGDTLQARGDCTPPLEADNAPPGLSGDTPPPPGGSSLPDCANFVRLCTVPSALLCALRLASFAALWAAARCSRLCRRLYL